MNVNSQDKRERRPLHWAANKVEVLLRSQAEEPSVAHRKEKNNFFQHLKKKHLKKIWEKNQIFI